MRKTGIIFLTCLSFAFVRYGAGKEPYPYRDSLVLKRCRKCMLLTDIEQHRIVAVDMQKKAVVWEWKPGQSNIPEDKRKWFINYSDVKPVYNKKYLLISSSAGGVALIRVADKKAVFFSYAGGNTHSIELLPDGNMVSASSTGNYLMLFHVDTLHFPDVYTRKIYMPAAHNVVWDRKRQLLWTASRTKLYSFKYNFDCSKPDLIPVDSVVLPGINAHDLFPVYGKDSLYLTTHNGVYIVNPETKKITPLSDPLIRNIKSVSSGPSSGEFPVIIMKPKTKWWSDEVLDIHGNRVFQMKGLRIYKARWFVDNTFSYNNDDSLRVCNNHLSGTHP